MIKKLTEFLFYLLFLLTPLVMYKNTSELFEFNKIIFIYLIAILIFIAWIFKIGKEKEIAFKRTFLDIPILIFLLTQIISTFFSIDFYTSIFGFYGRFNGGLLSIITYIFLYFAFVNLFDLKNIERLLKVSLISIFIVILWGLPGKFGYDLSCFVFLRELNNNCWVDQFKPSERLFSTLGQPNWLGAYLSINFFISLYFLFKEKAKSILNRKNLIFVGSTLLIFITILFTRSRSSYLGIVFGLILFSSFKFNFKKIAILLFIFLISVFIFKTGINSIDKFITFEKNKKETVITKETKSANNYLVTESFDIRKIVWEGAWKLGLKYPLFGSGVETFAYSYYFTRPQEHNLTSEWDFIYNKAHNEYLNYLATTGFVGLLSYLFLIGGVFFILIKEIIYEKDKQNKLIYITLLASYVTILTTNFFGFSTTTINLFFYLIPAFIGINIIKEQKEFIFKNKPFIFQVFGVSLGLVLLYFLTSYFIADLNYAKSEKASQIGDYQSAATYLDQANRLHNSHIYLNSYSLNVANLAVLLSYQKDSKQSIDLMKLALQKSSEAISASPKNVNYLKNKSKIEYLFYQVNPQDRKYVDSAISTLKKAQELSPTDAKIPYSLSIFYTILFDFTKDIKYKDLSFKEVDKSITLKSNFKDAFTLKTQLIEKYKN